MKTLCGPTTSPDPHPAALEVKRVSMGGGRVGDPPLSLISTWLTSQGTASVRTTGWAASWRTLGEFLGEGLGRGES